MFTDVYFHEPSQIIEQQSAIAFDELIVSWDGTRPGDAPLVFFVSLYQDGWSDWMKYAEWGAASQRTFKTRAGSFYTYQDTASPDRGVCTGYRIKIEGNLDHLRRVAVSCTNTALFSLSQMENYPSAATLSLSGRSQKILPHPRAKDLCSPTSTSSAVRFLMQQEIDPSQFSAEARDDEFDIYGNWILNTAAACHRMDGRYFAFVRRLESFSDLIDLLRRETPVVVSVKGEIEGGAHPYPNGHLMCVIGYDSSKQLVHCMDPAFYSDEETLQTYPLESFLKAWDARKRLAYIFMSDES